MSIFLFIFILVLVTPYSAFGEEPETTDYVSLFNITPGNELVRFYAGEDEVMNFIQDGVLFSKKKFREDTLRLYLKNDMDGLKKYVATERIYIEHSIKSEYKDMRALDVALTRTSQLTALLEIPDYGHTVEVTCYLRGTIFFNPNTYIVSHASKPIVERINLTNPSTSYSNVRTSSIKSTYSGYFSVQFDLFNWAINLQYQSFSGGFTIQAE